MGGAYQFSTLTAWTREGCCVANAGPRPGLLWVISRPFCTATAPTASPLEAAVTGTRRHSHFVPFPVVSRCSIGAHKAHSFDDLVCEYLHRNRHLDSKLLGSLHVDDQFELGGPFDRQIGRASAVKNLRNEGTGPAIELDQVRAIGHQAAAVRKGSKLRYSGDAAS